MKALLLLFTFVSSLLFISCQEQETASEFTGKSVVYPMIQGTYFDQPTTGTVTVKERVDGSVQIEIWMEGTMAGASHPVHLHRGSLLEDETVALYLSALEDMGNNQSQSITRLTTLEDEAINFDDFLKLDASIKVHFQETGELKNVVLGATNIGKNYQVSDVKRLDQSITTCNNF